MEPIKIDKNIPISTRVRQDSNKLYSIFEKMEVGDSFAVSIIDEKASIVRSRLYMESRNFKSHKVVSLIIVKRVMDN